MVAAQPFWLAKSLEELSAQEWESLCDGCGRCCLVKLEDEESGEVYQTDVACQLFDADSCKCSDYAQRQTRVDDCLQLTPQRVAELTWLPDSCGYRRVYERRPLPSWHPLVSGDGDSVHRAGASLQGRVISELQLPAEQLQERIVVWVDVAD
ncbi:YcgN family cysteine cluster protein [Gammaproteobacteria bacterium LSUCC0057]|uniref:UPF0260 protein E3W66_03885 n=1 Tax=Gammaproteobacteria bacterium LSUCC0057 TaxID=2559237 RepID=A0A4Y8UN29_9GAMM|nr:YcgN family cysteine cluster protein [Gammaproteobacteria bacterium LSUCC0057]